MRSADDCSKSPSPKPEFDFKHSVGQLQLDSKVMKLNLQAITKS